MVYGYRTRTDVPVNFKGRVYKHGNGYLVYIPQIAVFPFQVGDYLKVTVDENKRVVLERIPDVIKCEYCEGEAKRVKVF